jgi:hypothetical protein
MTTNGEIIAGPIEVPIDANRSRAFSYRVKQDENVRSVLVTIPAALLDSKVLSSAGALAIATRGGSVLAESLARGDVPTWLTVGASGRALSV